MHESSLLPLPCSLSRTKWNVENTKQRNQHGFFRFPAIATGKERILIYINLIKHYWSKAVTSKEAHAIWSWKETPEELCRKTGKKHNVIYNLQKRRNGYFLSSSGVKQPCLIFCSQPVTPYLESHRAQHPRFHIYKQAVLRQDVHKLSASYLWKLSGFLYLLTSCYNQQNHKCHNNCLYTSVSFCLFFFSGFL